MSRENIELAEEIQHAIETIGIERSRHLARTIAPVVMTNLELGRVHYFLDKQSYLGPVDYVWLVVEKHEKWHDYLVQIQEVRDHALWLPLYEKLQRWAFHYLSRKNFPQNGRTHTQHALDCATEAATRLLHARFPYDVDFDPWLSVLVQNVVRKHIEKEYRDGDKNPLSLDDSQVRPTVFTALALAPGNEKLALRLDLLAAIEQLASPARQQIILLHYFEGYSLSQIASKLEKSENAVYKLHYDALKNLRKILGDVRDINE